MYHGEAFEEFARPLRNRTAHQLRKLAESEGIRLPNINDRDILLQEIFAAKTNQASVTGLVTRVDSPAASVESPVPPPSVDVPAAGGPALKKPQVSVRAKRESYCRCGRIWSPSKVVVDYSDFSEEQWARMRKDSNLIVRDEV